MIDTNELRELADSLQYSRACKCGDNGKCHTVNIMEDSAAELDRLYEIERRTTPLTREEIEAEFVRRGWFSVWSGRIYRHEKRIYSVVVERDTLMFGTYSIPLSSVTLQLLDAVEAK